MKFTIRDMLLVTAIIALAIGLWIEHRRNAPLREENDRLKWVTDCLQQQMVLAGNSVTIDDDREGITISWRDPQSGAQNLTYFQRAASEPSP